MLVSLVHLKNVVFNLLRRKPQQHLHKNFIGRSQYTKSAAAVLTFWIFYVLCVGEDVLETPIVQY